MKYHERNDDVRFLVSLVIIAVITALFIAMPASRVEQLLGFF